MEVWSHKKWKLYEYQVQAPPGGDGVGGEHCRRGGRGVVKSALLLFLNDFLIISWLTAMLLSCCWIENFGVNCEYFSCLNWYLQFIQSRIGITWSMEDGGGSLPAILDFFIRSNQVSWHVIHHLQYFNLLFSYHLSNLQCSNLQYSRALRISERKSVVTY